MKKLILLLVFVTFMSCSTDGEAEQNCKEVQGKQIKYEPNGSGLNVPVYYFWLKGDDHQITVSETDYNNYDLGDTFCQ